MMLQADVSLAQRECAEDRDQDDDEQHGQLQPKSNATAPTRSGGMNRRKKLDRRIGDRVDELGDDQARTPRPPLRG